MSRTMDRNSGVSRVTRQAFLAGGLLCGMLPVSGIAAAQTEMSDAQVEANVLKALAAAPELANQSITTKTVYGTVTLSGSVSSEEARTKAENLAANAAGVRKVVDELRLGAVAAAPSAATADGGQQGMLQSDGTYAPAAGEAAAANPAPGTAPAETAQRNNPDADQALDQQMEQQQQAAQPGAAQPNATQPGTTASNQPAYPPPAATQPRRPIYSPAYPGYPSYPYGYPQTAAPSGAYAPSAPPAVVGGQTAGQPVTIPAGALLRVRLDRTLSSKITKAGTTFDGMVMNDVVAGGLVAIPRGATVQGKVVDAKSSGAISGRGELSIQLTSITLGGKSYPLTSDLWAHNGADKTIESVNKTLGLGAFGAIVGALAGGGKGAAIGGGVGAAAGLGSSAATPDRQVYIPAESVVIFHTTGENSVATVSEEEMQRLAYAAGPGGTAQPAPRPYRGYYPGYYPPPPGYPYPGYGYPNN